MTTLAMPGISPVAARFLTALGNEIRKGLAFAWSEKLQILIEMPFFAIFILLLGPLLGAGHQIAMLNTCTIAPMLATRSTSAVITSA